MQGITPDMILWWISVIEVPAMAALFALILKSRRDHDADLDHIRNIMETRISQLRESLGAHKLEVARSYASHNDVREIEKRVIAHLLRIEAKLDQTALKAEAMHAKTFKQITE